MQQASAERRVLVTADRRSRHTTSRSLGKSGRVDEDRLRSTGWVRENAHRGDPAGCVAVPEGVVDGAPQLGVRGRERTAEARQRRGLRTPRRVDCAPVSVLLLERRYTPCSFAGARLSARGCAAGRGPGRGRPKPIVPPLTPAHTSTAFNDAGARRRPPRGRGAARAPLDQYASRGRAERDVAAPARRRGSDAARVRCSGLVRSQRVDYPGRAHTAFTCIEWRLAAKPSRCGFQHHCRTCPAAKQSCMPSRSCCSPTGGGPEIPGVGVTRRRRGQPREPHGGTPDCEAGPPAAERRVWLWSGPLAGSSPSLPRLLTASAEKSNPRLSGESPRNLVV
jgi:hypothetical protein